jgi:hypothetical protein
VPPCIADDVLDHRGFRAIKPEEHREVFAEIASQQEMLAYGLVVRGGLTLDDLGGIPRTFRAVDDRGVLADADSAPQCVCSCNSPSCPGEACSCNSSSECSCLCSASSFGV